MHSWRIALVTLVASGVLMRPAAPAHADRAIAVSPRSLAFGVVSVGAHSDVMAVDAKSGTGRGTTATLNDADANFRLVDNSCTGTTPSCVVHVLFAPRSTGLKRAVLRFQPSNSSSSSKTVEVALRGTGVEPPGPIVSETGAAVALPIVALGLFALLLRRRRRTGAR